MVKACASTGAGALLRVRQSGMMAREMRMEAIWNGTAGNAPLAPSSNCPTACPE